MPRSTLFAATFAALLLTIPVFSRAPGTGFLNRAVSAGHETYRFTAEDESSRSAVRNPLWQFVSPGASGGFS